MTMLPMLLCGCSGHGSSGDARPRLDSVFVGFHLGDRRTAALEEVRRLGLEIGCTDDETFEPFCSPGLDAPAGKPVLALGFRDGRLVSVARSVRREHGVPHAGDWEAQYRREMGEPVVRGWLNPYLYARMWAGADSTVLGTLTCARPADPASCEMGLDRMPRQHVRQMLADWREMVARTDQRTAGRDATTDARRGTTADAAAQPRGDLAGGLARDRNHDPRGAP